jgi:hypothetical protein
MTMRFRIRTQGGQELSFASREMFEAFVRAGDLAPADLVYDSETASWAPARTHPIVLEIEYADTQPSHGPDAPIPAPRAPAADDPFGLTLAPAPSASHAESPARGDAPRESKDASHEASIGALEFTLAPQREVSPEDASRAFVEKLQLEREAEGEEWGSDGLGRIRMETPGGRADQVIEAAAPTPAASSDRGRPERGPFDSRPRPERPSAPPLREPPRSSRHDEGSEPPPLARPPRESPRWRGRRIAGLLGLGLIMAAGAASGVALSNRAARQALEPSGPDMPIGAIPVAPAPDASPSGRRPGIPRDESAVRGRAHELFLTATQAELRDLPPLPDAWPGAEYLMLPSGSPEVVGVFQQYLQTARALRGTDEARYRVAYQAALEDAGVDGEEAVDRLDAAMGDFAGTAERRDAHYERIERLASAAIGSHEALLEAEGLLVSGAPVNSADLSRLGAGVSGRDRDSQFLLEDVVTALEEALDGGGAGPRTPGNVRAWVWDGILDAVTG